MDFALWIANDDRKKKEFTFAGMVTTPSGPLRRGEFLGPPTIHDWIASWRVFRTAFIMLGIADVQTLDRYERHIAKCHRRYGEKAWALLYQAERRMRKEQFFRLYRRAAADHEEALKAGKTTPFDVNRPWNYILIKAVEDKAFWTEHFLEPVHEVTKVVEEVGYEAPVAPASSRHTPPSDAPSWTRDSVAPQPPTPPIGSTHNARKHRAGGARAFKVSTAGDYTHNRQDDPLCEGFIAGTCKSKGKSLICPRDSRKRHQCCRCLSSAHGRCDAAAKEPPAKRQRGRGGGRGRSRA